MKRSQKALAGALAMTVLSAVSAAANEMEDALAKGAVRLTAEQISERLADKTVTLENATSGAKVLVYYDGSNGIRLKPLGSNKMLKGF